VFSAIEREQLQGTGYAACRFPDGVTYLNLLQLEDGIQNPRRHCRRAKSSG
jgi:hypothetical protein